MTYIQRRHARRGKRGLGDFWDNITQPAIGSDQKRCLDQANALVAPMDAKIDDLARNWQPTGFYTPADVRDVIGATMKVVLQAQATLDQARAEPNASQESLIRASNDLTRAGQRSLDYLQSASDADAQDIGALEAPDLKKWVTNTLASASSALVTASVVSCIRPWWVGALAVFQAYFDIAWSVAKRLVGVAIAAGDTVLKVAEDIPQFYEYVKWAAIIGGGYWLWIQLSNLRASGKTIL